MLIQFVIKIIPGARFLTVTFVENRSLSLRQYCILLDRNRSLPIYMKFDPDILGMDMHGQGYWILFWQIPKGMLLGPWGR
jgi:hypothetical protein